MLLWRSGASAQLPGLVTALVGLLGPDQASEVQRAGLQVSSCLCSIS